LPSGPTAASTDSAPIGSTRARRDVASGVVRSHWPTTREESSGLPGEEVLGSRKVLQGVHCYAFVKDVDHLHGVAVFVEAQHFHSLGTLQGLLLDQPELDTPLSCAASALKKSSEVSAAKPS
jgi:hypothetical protein